MNGAQQYSNSYERVLKALCTTLEVISELWMEGRERRIGSSPAAVSEEGEEAKRDRGYANEERETTANKKCLRK